MKYIKSGLVNLILSVTGLLLLLFSVRQEEDKLGPGFYIALALFIISLVISIRYHRCPSCGAWLNSHVAGSFDFSTCPKCGEKLE